MANRVNLELVKEQPIEKMTIISVSKIPNSVTERKIMFDVNNLNVDGDHYLCSLPNEPYYTDMYSEYSAKYLMLLDAYKELAIQTEGDLPFNKDVISKISGGAGVAAGVMSITALVENYTDGAILIGAVSATFITLSRVLNEMIKDSKSLTKEIKQLRKYLLHYEGILKEAIKIESEYKMMTFVDNTVVKQKVIPLSVFRR